MVSIGDVVAAERRGLDLDALFVERVDSVATAIDEPVDRFALSGPPLMRGLVLAFVGALDLIREMNEGQVLECGKAEHFTKAPLPAAVAADLAMKKDQVCERHLDHF